MPQNDQTFRLTNDVGSLGLRCAATGVSLAGVPLLRKTLVGLEPRPTEEIGALLEEAYGQPVDPANVSPGLDVIAQALNRGDLGRAMIAAVHLRLPELSWDGAARIAKAHGGLTKYDPDEPRDERGRWTTDGASGPNMASSPGAFRHDSRPDVMTPIPVANRRLPDDDPASIVCNVATRQCQLSALDDKTRPYFDSCWKAENACELVVSASRSSPEQPFYVIYPDRTVVSILDGTAIITHIAGTRLQRPFSGR